MREFFRKFLMLASVSVLKLVNFLTIFSYLKRIKGKYFFFTPDVFNPIFLVVSSSFFLQNLMIPKGASVLDMGTGSGILAIFAAERAQKVMATDLNPNAIENAKINIQLNRLSKKIELRRGNLFKPIVEKFDVILFNPPYYPLKPKTYMEIAWFCGPNYLFIRKFLAEVKNHLTKKGFVLISFSSLMHLELVHKLLKKNKLSSKIIARKFLLFEILYLYILYPIAKEM